MEAVFGETLGGGGQDLAAPLLLPGGVDFAHAASEIN